MKIAKIIIINIIIIFFILIVFNIFFLLYFHNFLSQKKKIDRYYVYHLDKFYHKFYADTYFNLDNDYVAILGDSMAAGDGDAWTKRMYNYSSLHFLKNNFNDNFLNFGHAGSGSFQQVREFIGSQKIMTSYPFKLKSKPKKIFFYFYEGNDITDNLIEKEVFNLDYNDKNLYKLSKKRYLKIYFPVFISLKNIIIDRFIHHYIIIKKRLKNKKSKNQNYLENKNSKSIIQITDINYGLHNLTEEKIDIALNIFFKNLNNLKNEINVPITIIYIPNQVTISSVEELTEFVDLNLEDKVSNDKISKNINYKIKDFANKNNISYISLVAELSNINNKKNLYGHNDILHFSQQGYKEIANIIYRLSSQ